MDILCPFIYENKNFVRVRAGNPLGPNDYGSKIRSFRYILESRSEQKYIIIIRAKYVKLK